MIWIVHINAWFDAVGEINNVGGRDAEKLSWDTKSCE